MSAQLGDFQLGGVELGDGGSTAAPPPGPTVQQTAAVTTGRAVHAAGLGLAQGATVAGARTVGNATLVFNGLIVVVSSPVFSNRSVGASTVTLRRPIVQYDTVKTNRSVGASFALLNDPTQPFRLFINGVDRSKLMRVNTLKVHRANGNMSTAEMTLHDPTGALTITNGQSIVVYFKTIRLFGGIIYPSRSITALPSTTATDYAVKCTGYAQILTRINISFVFDPATLDMTTRTVQGAVSLLYTRYLLGKEPISYDILNAPTTVLTTKLDFSNFVTFAAALDAICAAGATSAGTPNWYVDDYGILHVQMPGDAAAPFTITNTSRRMLVDTAPVVTVDDANFANAIVLKTNASVGGTYTETFHGNGDITQYFFLQNGLLPGDVPQVKLNGVDQVVVTYGDPFDFSYKFTYIDGGNALVPRSFPPSIVPFALTDVIEITYKVKASNIAIRKDSVSIAARKATGDGSGEYQFVADMSNSITDAATANAYADALLLSKSTPYTTFKYATDSTLDGHAADTDIVRLQPGQTQSVTFTHPPATGNYFLDAIDFSDKDGRFLVAEVTGTIGKSKAQWDKILADLLAKQPPKPTNVDVHSFDLATTIPGKINPGIIVTPTPVLNKWADRAGVAFSAALQTANPPTSGQVVVDILHNGVSILVEPMVWSAGNGDPVIGQIIGGSFAYAQYASFSVQVLQVGSDVNHPGSDFNVTLIATPDVGAATSGFLPK